MFIFFCAYITLCQHMQQDQRKRVGRESTCKEGDGIYSHVSIYHGLSSMTPRGFTRTGHQSTFLLQLKKIKVRLFFSATFFRSVRPLCRAIRFPVRRVWTRCRYSFPLVGSRNAPFPCENPSLFAPLHARPCRRLLSLHVALASSSLMPNR